MQKSILSFAAFLVAFSACAAQRPVLYPNEYFKRVGNASAERDTNDCLRQAEEYVSSSGRVGSTIQGAATGAATSASIGAAAGAAAGAVGGTVLSGAGTGAAIGAAGGGAAGATRGLISGISGRRDPPPIQRSFVNRCLREKGYEPIGWQ